MYFEMKPSAVTRIAGVIVTHKGKSVEFNGKAAILAGDNTSNIFKTNNDYWDYLDEHVLDKLFELYCDAKRVTEPAYFTDESPNMELLLNNGNYQFLINHLRPITDKILELIKPDNFCNYVGNNPEINKIPHDLQATANISDYPEEKNVNEYEYLELVKLGLLIRFIFPIAMDLVNNVGGTTGKSYQEVMSGELVKHNPTITNHPGWLKLVKYSRFNYNAKVEATPTLSVAEHKLVDHAVYKTLFTKLACCHIPSKIPDKNIAKLLYSGMKPFDTVESKIRNRNPENSDDDDKQSNYDKIRAKEGVNSAKQEAQAEYFSFGLFDEEDNPKYKDAFKYQCLGLNIPNPELVEKCYNLIPNAWNFTLTPHVAVIAGLIFKGCASPDIIYSLNFVQMKAYLALAQVKLHLEGYPNLAVLLTSVVDEEAVRYHNSDILDLTTSERDIIISTCDIYCSNGNTTTDNAAVHSMVRCLRSIGDACWVSTIELGMLENPELFKSVKVGEMYEVFINREIKSELINLLLNKNQE